MQNVHPGSQIRYEGNEEELIRKCLSEITPRHTEHIVAPGITYSFEGHHFQCFSRELVVLLPASVLFSQKLIPLLDAEHQFRPRSGCSGSLVVDAHCSFLFTRSIPPGLCNYTSFSTSYSPSEPGSGRAQAEPGGGRFSSQDLSCNCWSPAQRLLELM